MIRRNLSLEICLLLALVVVTPAWSQSAVRSLQIAPNDLELELGQSRTIVVTAYDSGGNVVPSVDFQVSGGGGVVRASRLPNAPGLVRVEALGYGNVQLSVRFSGVTASASVRVVEQKTPAADASTDAALLQVVPANIFLLPTEELELRPIFYRQDGTQTSGPSVRWRSAREEVARVGENGVVVAVQPGQGAIEASSAAGLTGRAFIQVANAQLAFARPDVSIEPNQFDTLRVVVPEQSGRAVGNTQLMWSSTNQSVARVSPFGVLTGVSPGTAEIVVTGFGQQHRQQVSVHRPVEQMVVTPVRGDVAVPQGGYVEFEVKMLGADGAEVPEARVQWMVADTGIVSFDPVTRRILGARPGSTQLVASGPRPEFRAEWTVNVIVGGLDVGPRRLGLTPSDELDLQAFFADVEGNRLGRAAGVSWSSTATAVADVNAAGHLTARAVGAATIVAVSPYGAADSIDVFVQHDLLFTSNRTGGGDIYAADPSRIEAAIRVSSGDAEERSAVFSPDGSRIAFVTNVFENAELFVMNADGSNPVRLSMSQGEEAAPTWNGNGQIVYEVNEGRTTNLWTVNVDGTGARALTNGSGRRAQPTVSPDGKFIAYRWDGKEIHVMAVDGTRDRAITLGSADYHKPQWVSNDVLAYMAARRDGRIRQQYVEQVNLTSGEVLPLTAAGVYVADFAVSSDGEQLAVVLQLGGRGERILHLMRVTPDMTGEMLEVLRTSNGEETTFPSYRR